VDVIGGRTVTDVIVNVDVGMVDVGTVVGDVDNGLAGGVVGVEDVDCCTGTPAPIGIHWRPVASSQSEPAATNKDENWYSLNQSHCTNDNNYLATWCM
jgi:hypothetical protein